METLDKEHFNTVKEIAEMTVKISEMRETLNNLEKSELEFIEARENKAKEKINDILAKSGDLLSTIRENNEQIHILFTMVSSYKEFLDEGYERFNSLLKEFKENSELWDKKVEEQYIEFGELEKQANRDKEEIRISKNEIEKEKAKIERDKIKIADQREVIKRAVERLKLNKK